MPSPRKSHKDHGGELHESRKSKLVLITGGNKGIGLETARHLGTMGYEILIGARSENKGHEAVTLLEKETLLQVNWNCLFSRVPMRQTFSVYFLSLKQCFHFSEILLPEESLICPTH